MPDTPLMEYRVAWKREGLRRKYRLYQKESAAKKFLTLLGPEPWLAYGKKPDELECCSGRECSCGGMTHREASEEIHKSMPPLEDVRLESRRIGKWEPTDA